MKTVAIWGLMAAAALLGGCGSDSGQDQQTNPPTPATYEEKIQSVESIERAQPTRFLSASANYRPNLLRNKLKIEGVIQNTATVATYKDAVIQVIFYSKTQTILGSENYTIYEFFPPTSKTPFSLKVDAYQNVDAIGVDVISAANKE